MKPRASFLALCLAAAGFLFQPASAEEITVAVGSGFTTLDPYDATDMLSRAAAKSFYEGLFTFDENMKPVPDTAQLVPRASLGRFKYSDSRKNHSPYPAVIQLSPKFLEFR